MYDQNPQGAFDNCEKLTDIKIPAGVTEIGMYAFSGSGVKSVTLPAGITEIKDATFSNCRSLTTVVIPQGVTKINDWAFLGSGITSLKIPDSVTFIGEDVFPGCTSLTSITIPKSVTEIANGAFSNCPLLDDVYYDGTKSDWDKINIGENNKGIEVPEIHLGDGTVIPSKKSDNTLTAKEKTAKVKYKKLRKKAQTVSRAKVLTVSNAQGNVTYKLTSVKRGKSKKYKKYFKINATNGDVTIKKKLKKGTYKVTCVVAAAGYSNYKAGTKTVTFKIKVK